MDPTGDYPKYFAQICETREGETKRPDHHQWFLALIRRDQVNLLFHGQIFQKIRVGRSVGIIKIKMIIQGSVKIMNSICLSLSFFVLHCP